METAYIRWKMARSMKKSLLRRPFAYVRVGATETCGEPPYAVDERALVAQGTAGISAIEETLLGLPLLGPRRLFDNQRYSHRRHRTAVLRAIISLMLPASDGSRSVVLRVAAGAFRRRRLFLFHSDVHDFRTPGAVVGIRVQRVDPYLVGGVAGVVEGHEFFVIHEVFVGGAREGLAL